MGNSYLIESYNKPKSADSEKCNIYTNGALTIVGEDHSKKTFNRDYQEQFEHAVQKADVLVVERRYDSMAVNFEDGYSQINTTYSYSEQTGKYAKDSNKPLFNLDDMVDGTPDFEKVGLDPSEYWFIEGFKRVNELRSDDSPLNTLPKTTSDGYKLASFMLDNFKHKRVPEDVKGKFWQLFKYGIYLESAARDLQYYELITKLQNQNPEKKITAILGQLHAHNIDRMLANNGEPYHLSTEELNLYYQLKDDLYKDLAELNIHI